MQTDVGRLWSFGRDGWFAVRSGDQTEERLYLADAAFIRTCVRIAVASVSTGRADRLKRRMGGVGRLSLADVVGRADTSREGYR